jgi:cholesterol transport system auxiliary component
MTNRPILSWGVAGALTLSAAVSGGCGAARPSKYYQLTVPGDVASASDPSAIPVTLLLGPLTSSHLYREDRIVYSAVGQNMGTYEFQRWAEPPTEMMQDVLFRELRASGRYRDVSSLRSNAHGDYLLRGRLYDFKEVSGNPLSARVAVEYELRETKTGTTVWSHYYAHDEPVNGKEVSAIVAALDHNVQNIMGEVKAGLEQYFSAHPPAPSAVAPKQ